jgi:glycosyltransferase involved in cell wall biosynthesis
MNKKIKIIYYLSTLNAGGAERVTVNLIRKLDREKFDIYLILVERVGPFLDLIPDYVKIVDLSVKKTLFSILKLKKEIKRIEPDIIYSTLFRTHIAIDLALLLISYRPKRVFRSPSSPKTLIQREEIGWLMRFFIKRAYKNADKILAQTPEMKEEISFYHGINRGKIDVFLNPLDVKLIDDKIQNITNPFDENRINILAAGRLSTVKGFDTLLYAFKHIYDKNSNFYLHIIGRDGGEQDRLISIAKELGIEHSIKLWGFQENPYKFFYYSQLFVLSSRREGLPNTVLENIYIGKPIIATKCIPFMSELIDDGGNGFLVDVDDSLALADAILNYKKLIPYSGVYNSLDINEIFKNIVK